MQKLHRTAAVVLGVLMTACSTAPTLAPAARMADANAMIRAAAVSETASLLRELRAVNGTIDRRQVAPEDLRELDGDRNGVIDGDEVAREFAKTMQGAINAAPAAASVQNGVTLPQFFVNPNLQPNDTDLLIDEQEIFPELMAMLQSAESKIQMDFFLLGGEIGLSIARVLAQKHAEGVEVNLMMDPKLGLVGPTAAGIHRVVEFLKLKGVPYKFFPLALFGQMPNGLQNKMQIDHNKILVVDGKRSLIGSMNLDDGARMNHDIMVKVEGPTAAELSAMLAAEWGFGTDPTKTMRTQAQSLMRLSQTAPQERTTRELLLREIARASRSIHVAMYEFGDPELTDALVKAYRRGVDVRVLLDDKANIDKYLSVPVPDGLPNISPARTFFDNGVQVRWYKNYRYHQELHMKMAIFDGARMVAGSTNWTTNAMNRWRETSFMIEGPTAVEAQGMFLKDWEQNARRIDKITLKQRIVAKVVDWMNKHDRAFW